MASPANNSSSSSPPIPNRPNPKPRNSEAGDPLRRSFKDFSRRNSFGGDKENETKAYPTPKGSKNFMLPTISAVSKINASPRKRVLSDKNEMSRSFSDVKGQVLDDNKSHHPSKSCVSFSDVLQIIGDDKDKQILGINGKKQFEESHDMTVTEDDKDEQIFSSNGKKQFEESHDITVTDFDKEVLENKEIAYSDPRFSISPRPCVQYTSPEFAESEVDSMLPPYDPKKNYLSPRPRFLHYKLNSRIEHHFDECKQLEELFISESSSSDTELSVEESENCEEQDKNGAELEVVEETEDVKQLQAESDEEMVCESIEETIQVPKQSGFKNFKFLCLFLTLAMAYLLVSATFSLPTESQFYEFHIPREFTEFAIDNNLEELSEKLWTFTESSLVYISKLISGFGGEKDYGPWQYCNLTCILEDNTAFQPTSVEISEEPIQEKIIGGNNLGDVYGEDGYVNEFAEESVGEEVVFEIKDGDVETNKFDEQTEMKRGTDIEVNEDEGNLNAQFEDGEEWSIEEQSESEMFLEENDEAGGSASQEKLETISSKTDEEEPEAIYISQHDVESAAIIVHQEIESAIADAESGSEEGFGEIAAETSDLHLKVRSFNRADHDLAKTDAESVSQEAFEEITGETSDDLHLKVRSSNKADNDLAKTDAESASEEAFGEITGETSDDLHLKVRSSNKADNDLAKTDAESVSEEAFGEITGETSDDHHPKARFSNEATLVLSSTALVLLAAIAFLFAKKAKTVAASAPEPAPKATELNSSHVPKATEELNSSHVPVDNLKKEKLSSLNFEAEVDDRMSNSFHKKSSFHKDPQSKGDSKKSNNSSNKLKRESMASSASEYSVGSVSYGSFTTYEKISIKSGDKEEEMITPVRRSSRIRKNQPSGL